MNLYPDVTVERYFNSAWDDISSYVVNDIDISMGFTSNKYIDRLANEGYIKFDVNNVANTFVPETDFFRGMKIRITIDVGSGITKTFIGYVDYITPPVKNYGLQSIKVECFGWLGFTTTAKIRTLVTETDKRANDAIVSLLSLLPIQPTATSLANGNTKFPVVFDEVRLNKTTFYEEFNRIVQSELGYLYTKNDGTLVLENLSYRDNLEVTPFQVSTISTDIGYLLKEDGGYLLQESGDKLLLNLVDSITYSGVLQNVLGVDVGYSDNIVNDISFSVNPRQVDMGEGQYYQLYTYNLYDENPPIVIPNGTSITLKGGYPESVGGKIPDSALDVQTPAVGGVSSFTVSPAGTTGMTFDFSGGATSWYWKITNNSGVTKSITVMEWFGRPVFNSQPLEYYIEDTTSSDKYGTSSVSVNQDYAQKITNSVIEANLLLEEEKDPRYDVSSITKIANVDEESMLAFMTTDIGDLRRVILQDPQIDSPHFVQGIKAKISPSGMIEYEFKLKEHLRRFTPIALRYSGVASSKNVTKFTDTSLDNIAQKTIFFRIYFRDGLTAVPVLSKYDGSSGWEIFIHTGALAGRIEFNSNFSTNRGAWRTPANTMTSLYNAWHSIAVTYDNSSIGNDPIIYLDGSPLSITEADTPSGTVKDDAGITLNIGNRNYTGTDRIYDFAGSIKDIKIFDGILSASEVSQLDASEQVTDGLTFSAPVVKTADLANYIGVPISKTDPIYNNINHFYGYVDYASVTNGEIKGEN